MVWTKLFWLAVLCLPCFALLAYVFYNALDNPQSGYHRTSKLETQVMLKTQRGISSPPLQFLAEPFVSVATESGVIALNAFLEGEETKLIKSYTFKKSSDVFYNPGGALIDQERLDDEIENAEHALAHYAEQPAGSPSKAELADIVNVSQAHKAYFNPNNDCAIGLIRLTRYIGVDEASKVALTLELTPVSNAQGTLLKFKLWKLKVDYAACVIPRWRDDLALQVRISLSAVAQDSSGTVKNALLLDDIITLPLIKLGREYDSEHLIDYETAWFPFPQRSTYTMGTTDGSGRVEELRDMGAYSVAVQVTEAALQ